MTLRGLPPRLRWFIVLVASAGLAASAAVVLLQPGDWSRSVWPSLAALLVLTAALEIAASDARVMDASLRPRVAYERDEEVAATD